MNNDQSPRAGDGIAPAVRYTSAMGAAADAYINKLGGRSSTLPTQFRWEECLAAMLAASPAAPSVPAGWKLVPENPTAEMIKAGRELSGEPVYQGSEVAEIYRDMLAAAPAAAPAELSDEQIDKMVNAWFSVSAENADDYRTRMRQAVASIQAPATVAPVCSYRCEAFPECGCVTPDRQQALAAINHVLDCLLRDSPDEIQAAMLDRAAGALQAAGRPE